jgi:uracil-DNA glycosylase family 4
MALRVTGEGPRNAKLMIVGEAPAYHEVREGRPFVGDAGKELDKLLAAANIRREEVFITNACQEQVRGDKAAFFFQGGKPSPVFMESLVLLYQDIQTIRPNCIVALGNYAQYALLGQATGILKNRGSILFSTPANCKVVPTLHPAALLRGKPDDSDKSSGGMYKYRNPVIWDLQRAREQSGFPELRLRPRHILIDPVGEELDRAISRLLAADVIVADIESWGGTRLACIGYSDGDPEWAVVLSGTSPDRFDLHRAVLESDIPKVGQNLMYDATMLDQNKIHMKNIVHDTMIAQHVLLPDLPKGLDFLTSIYTDMPYYKDEGKVWNKPKTPAIEAQYYLYNGKDICSTSETYLKQKAELEAEGLNEVFQRSMMVFEPLRWATYRGMKCDLTKMWKLIDQTQKKLESAQTNLNELAGWDVNVNSHVQVKKLLYDQLKLSDRKNQSSDAPTILNIAANTGHRAPYLVIGARKEQKLLSNYYKAGILSLDARIRFGFNVVGTFGARISSAAPLWGPGLNGQNIPAEAREMFVPDPGYTLVEFDQAQAEAVIVAYLANDPVHMDCFRNGKDVHRVTACLLLDRPASDWQKIPKPSPIRELAKTCNHELNYNAGPGQFQMTVNESYDPDDPETVKIDFGMAKRTRDKYLQTRPALTAYWESIKSELKRNRTLVTPLGRRYQFLDMWSDEMLRKAYSYKPQCTVGETTNMGICQVLGISDLEKEEDERYLLQREIKRLDYFFSLQVHDSTIWQVRTEQLEEFVKLAMPLLEVPLYVNGYRICVPIEGTASELWTKDKKKVRDLGISRKSVEL